MTALGASGLMHQLAAQTVCLSPTEQAREVVEFSMEQPDSALRSIMARYRIVVKRTTDISPLTDRDAARCRQLDSLFKPHPVYYWRAGRAIIATNYSDSLMRIVKSEWYPFFRVFNEQGIEIYPTPAPIPIRKDRP